MDDSQQSIPDLELGVLDSTSRRRKIVKRALTVFIVLILIMGIRQAWPYLIEPEPEVLISEHQISEVADGLGSPSCLNWMNETWLLVCDRDGRLLALELNSDGDFTTQESILSDLIEPHGVLVYSNQG